MQARFGSRITGKTLRNSSILYYYMETALAASIITSLLLACICRAASPGGLLSFVGGWWETWLINRPHWLPGKPSGDCALCTAFWCPGVPVAVAVALCTPVGWWALSVPFLTSIVFDLIIRR